jgi:formylglycine-generating enzyme required for sulfatase activity
MDRYHQLRQVVLPEPDADAVPKALWKPAVPAPLWLAEARATFAAGNAIRAAAALQAFLDKATADTPERAEAMALRERYGKAAAAAKTARSRAARAAKPRLARSIAQQMVDIPAGSFQMGDLSGVNHYDHKPVFTTVAVKAFRLSRYEVTYEQYDQYADATGRERPRILALHGPAWEFVDEFAGGRGKLPVANVGWKDAQGFIAWLNERTGRKFRLPTEAEWEYAARAGSHSNYPWGEKFDAHLANGDGIEPGDRWYSTAPVGSFPPNAWGLYDMIGNVWEWTQDCYEERYGNAPADGSARGGLPDCRHVTRGGGSNWPAYYLYSSSRFEANIEDTGDPNEGFRLAEDE